MDVEKGEKSGIGGMSPEGMPRILQHNRLGECGSLYLRQHARNPVPWRVFGPEALQEARLLNRPVLLSSGYASCHWCHVMERESFEDPEVASLLARHFVPVKVDREERPDVDGVYLKAVEAMTGQAGWPLTVFLTPEGYPFFGGTYFPRDAFLDLCRQVAVLWETRGEEVRSRAGEVWRWLSAQSAAAAADGASGRPGDWGAVASVLRDSFDPVHGGLRGAMKFPQVPVLELAATLADEGDEELGERLRQTLRAMARGGIHDLVGGGFHRYSTRPDWTVPHFEKMLYDNAALLRLYADASQRGIEGADQVAGRTAEFLTEEMRCAEGVFAASMDADDPQGEGAFYRWTLPEMEEVLGREAGRALWDLLVGAPDPEHPGACWLDSRRVVRAEDVERLEQARGALREARRRRPPPRRDEKAVLEWNAMALGALAHAGLLLGELGWIETARLAADALEALFRAGGRTLGRAYNRGAPEGVPTPADLAQWGLACLDLHGATGMARFLVLADDLAREVMTRFLDIDGGLYLVPDGPGDLPGRPRAEAVDHPTPSPIGALARFLVHLEHLQGPGGPVSPVVEHLLGVWVPRALAHPQAAPWTLLAAWERADGWMAVLAGDPGDPRALALARAFRKRGTLAGPLAWVPPEGLSGDSALACRFPALRGKCAADGRGPALLVCGRGTCLAPILDPKDLGLLPRTPGVGMGGNGASFGKAEIVGSE